MVRIGDEVGSLLIAGEGVRLCSILIGVELTVENTIGLGDGSFTDELELEANDLALVGECSLLIGVDEIEFAFSTVLRRNTSSTSLTQKLFPQLLEWLLGLA